jgi:peptidoglycan/LPS O-acetylase OafA/YrhL
VSEVQRWPAFDGIRAVAIVSVMAYHLEFHHFLRGGYVGVDVFFVLSGFLITWLLTTEIDRFSAIDIRKFYARRALRLFPLLAAVVVGSVLLVVFDGAFATARHVTIVAVPFVVLYVGNWRVAFTSLTGLGILGVAWSLAIEEQFYLLWPMALSALLKRANRLRIALALVGVAALEMVARGVLEQRGSWLWAYMSTLTHSDGLLIGSALALLWTVRGDLKLWRVVERCSCVLGVASAAVLAAVILLGNPGVRQMFLWIAPAVTASAGILVSVINQPENVLSRVLQWRVLQWIGKRSYGCYLLHVPIFLVVANLPLPDHHVRVLIFLLDFAGTFLLAGISYQFMERPFLRRKVRFTRVAQVAGAST